MGDNNGFVPIKAMTFSSGPSKQKSLVVSDPTTKTMANIHENSTATTNTGIRQKDLIQRNIFDMLRILHQAIKTPTKI
jgi:hypothetical protein